MSLDFSWEWGIWVAVAIGALFLVATIMNLAWGSEEESRGAKNLLIQLLGGAALVVVVGLVINFAVKPLLAMIAQAAWYIFT